MPKINVVNIVWVAFRSGDEIHRCLSHSKQYQAQPRTMYRSSATPILSATILKSNTHGLCVAPKLLVFPWTVIVRQRLYAETTVPSPFRLTTKPSLRIVHATKSYCLVLSANCAGPSDALMESKTTLFVRPLSQKPKRRGQISPCRRA